MVRNTTGPESFWSPTTRGEASLAVKEQAGKKKKTFYPHTESSMQMKRAEIIHCKEMTEKLPHLITKRKTDWRKQILYIQCRNQTG